MPSVVATISEAWEFVKLQRPNCQKVLIDHYGPVVLDGLGWGSTHQFSSPPIGHRRPSDQPIQGLPQSSLLCSGLVGRVTRISNIAPSISLSPSSQPIHQLQNIRIATGPSLARPSSPPYDHSTGTTNQFALLRHSLMLSTSITFFGDPPVVPLAD